MLREVENLYWYDGPLCGVYEDVTGQKKLAARLADDDAPDFGWPMLVVDVTEQIVELVSESHITLKNAFLTGKNPIVYDLCEPHGIKSLDVVPDDWYPGDCYLDCRGKCKCGHYKD